jgi:hypothetical protein
MALAGAGDTVWVSNGIYAGSMGEVESATNVVIIPAGAALRSANGPVVTVIDGQQRNRCVYLAQSNTVLDGFTLTGGDIDDISANGGGAYCLDYALITNCYFVSNSAYYGGGCYLEGGYVSHCTFETNTAYYYGGGVCCWDNADSFGGRVVHCVVRRNRSGGGGGLFGRYAQFEHCLIHGNTTKPGSYDGGGVYFYYTNSYLQNCLIYSNYAGRNGGGVYGQFTAGVYNCTIIENTCGQSGGGLGVRNNLRVINTILYGNHSLMTESNYYSFEDPPVYIHCCMSPLTNAPANINNIDQHPRAAAPGCRLSAISPCVDAGTNMAWMIGATDFGGDPRIFNRVVDIGADETCVAGIGIQGIDPVQLTWRVPVGATCQWQTVFSPTGTWTDAGGVITAQTDVITYDDSSGGDQTCYRLIWEK